MTERLMLDPTAELFKRAWASYKEQFNLLAAITAAPFLLMAVGFVLINTAHMLVLTGIVLVLAGLVVLVMASVALVFAVAKKSTTPGDAYGRAAPLFWRTLWLGILVELTMLGGFFMLVIPAIIMGTWFLFAYFAFALEGFRGIRAMSRSREYSRGYWWPVFGRFFVFGLVFGIISVIVHIAVVMVAGMAAGSVVYYLFVALVLPLQFTYIYELYENLRRVKPSLAAHDPAPSANRAFFMTSAIIGIAAPVILLFLFIRYTVPWASALEAQEQAAQNAATTTAEEATTTFSAH